MRKYYIGHSSDDIIRFKATSGGIGSAIISYLLDTRKYGTAIDFYWDSEELLFKPRFIYELDEYSQHGSIYHDIDLVSYVKENVDKIKNGIIITCLPCQVKPIRTFLERLSINCFIMTFACSGQTEIAGTYKFYELAKVSADSIKYMQYRGNGWPSGIQVYLNNGTTLYFPNYSEPWKSIHRSHLYRSKRCFLCMLDTSYEADISLADPWLERLKNDSIGNTLFICNTPISKDIVAEMSLADRIDISEVNVEDWNISQKNNVGKKQHVQANRKYLLFERRLCSNSLYRRLFSKNLMLLNFHIKLCFYIKKYFFKSNALKITDNEK